MLDENGLPEGFDLENLTESQILQLRAQGFEIEEDDGEEVEAEVEVEAEAEAEEEDVDDVIDVDNPDQLAEKGLKRI